jgi:hypothetical protein
MTGAPAVPHRTLVNVAVVGVPVAGWRKYNTNEAPEATAGIVTVQAVADVNVAV